MPQFQVDTEKQFGTEFWTNRYIFNAADLPTARDAADIIVQRERAIHTNRAFFTVARTRTYLPNDGVFTNNAVAQSGLRASSTSYLPLFNVMRVDFSVLTGRPSRKFYRLPIEEGDVNDTQFSNDLITLVATQMQGLIADMVDNSTPLVDPQGQVWLTPAVYTNIAMRQLRRGSRRRTQPIL